MVAERLALSMLNILCPPLAIYILAGAGNDLLFNSLLFLLAVFPSHVHCFYLTSTYYRRKRRVRKGLPPGGAKPLIWSSRVLNGGASDREVQRLKRSESTMKRQKEEDRRAKKHRTRKALKQWFRFGKNKEEGRASPNIVDTSDPGVAQWLNEQERLGGQSSRRSSLLGVDPLPEDEELRPPLPQRRATPNAGFRRNSLLGSNEERSLLPQRSESCRIDRRHKSPAGMEQSPPLPPRRQLSQIE